MKITLQWMREFTPVGASPREVADSLTRAGLEVESVMPVAPSFTNVVVGEVLAASRHPNAEKLSVCEVTTSGSDRLTIVCGAPNVRAGLKVALAKVGAVLPGGVAIKAAKLRGVESNGMLCSARELGLGEEHDGIMELPSGWPLGTDVRVALDLDDSALEVNATPNRGDCMSVFGIARDYAAATARQYLRYHVAPTAAVSAAAASVQVDAAAACPIFARRVIRGVRANGASPAWLRERLRQVGAKSISPVVDVTNYVMLECGQPLHAYDLAKLSGEMRVRFGRDKERLTLLDGREHELDSTFLVIADDRGPIGLAGIMGGLETAISAATTDVLLEAAHFVPAAVAGRARRLGLFTDAGQRFERGVDPTLPELAIERATALLLEIAGGEPGPLQSTVAAPDPEVGAARPVALRRGRLAGLLGAPVPDSEVEAVLGAVMGNVEATTEGWQVIPPAHRFDVRIEADLIEEVARLRGFDLIPERHASIPQVAGHATESRVDGTLLLWAMTDAGYREILTYSFVDPVLQRQVFPTVPALALANAISADLSEMRVSLWPGLLQAARENVRRQLPRVRLFEIGKAFRVGLDGTGAVPLAEVETLSGLATGPRWPEQWGTARAAVDFYDVKNDLEAVLSLTGAAAEFRFEPESLDCLRPGRTARIYRGPTPVGWLGEIHPSLAKALDVPGNTLLFELEIGLAFSAKVPIYKPISKFPSIRRDLSIVVDESLPLAALRENVTVSASGLLSELRIFDVYRGAGIESGRKSVALGLILQDSSRTLTDVDADAVVTSVVARLRDVLSASIRD